MTDLAALQQARDEARSETHTLAQRVYSLRDRGKPRLLAQAEKAQAAAQRRLEEIVTRLDAAYEIGAAS